MNSRFDDDLSRVAAEAFSTLGFMFPAGDADPALKVTDPGAVVVSVGFTGPVSGTLDLKVTADVLPVLASNMTGADEPPPENEQRDALGEILNVICGNMLPLLTDAKAVYDVGAPQSCQGSPEHTGETLVGSTGLPLETGQAELSLFVNEPAAVA